MVKVGKNIFLLLITILVVGICSFNVYIYNEIYNAYSTDLASEFSISKSTIYTWFIVNIVFLGLIVIFIIFSFYRYNAKSYESGWFITIVNFILLIFTIVVCSFNIHCYVEINNAYSQNNSLNFGISQNTVYLWLLANIAFLAFLLIYIIYGFFAPSSTSAPPGEEDLWQGLIGPSSPVRTPYVPFFGNKGVLTQKSDEELGYRTPIYSRQSLSEFENGEDYDRVQFGEI